ncbi:fatty acyl-CoA reductase wat-like [Diorhabda carinulata]|uniref:fatty acyl-CoA reductase wat-like n=1 Tax=Diorhabda carinulata TaxID=1163345 RepID=UPI0025A0CCE1|nr:fatty acyl-CoA reductase wat-like [Diorhabda carinulata]
MDQPTPIQKLFRNANVFITGGTGFMGKILIEKLLRSTEVNTIYLLVREKKGKSIHTRIDELFEDVIFDEVKKKCPKFKHKIEAISGECQLSGLGLNIIDMQTLISKVNIIFHVAATVRFDENIKIAYDINVNGIKYVIDLARKMTNLKSIVHVSTAYSNCTRSVIEEKIYDCPLSYEDVGRILEKISHEEADALTPRLLGEWPNTYTYTKALAENLVNDIGKGLPLAIFRPSIIVSTYKEPIPGWIDNLYGPTGCCAGVVTGVLRVLYCDPNLVADIVPIDTCVSALISIAWDLTTKKSDTKSEITVYNYVSEVENPVKWQEFIQLNILQKYDYPVTNALWTAFVVLTHNKYIFWLLTLCLHMIPGIILDAFAVLTRHKPKMIEVYKKVHKFTTSISYFSTRSWKFSNKNTTDLWEKLDDRDKKLFLFSLTLVNWLQFFRFYIRGIRRYLLNESDNTLKEAKQKQKWLGFFHTTVKYSIIFLIYSAISKLFSTGLSLMF